MVRAEGRLENGLTAAMGTGDDFANPVVGELDMAPAVLAGALEMSLGFWHELPPIYDAAGLVNTQEKGIGTVPANRADFELQARHDKPAIISGPGLD
jgi:hypothetical protein